MTERQEIAAPDVAVSDLIRVQSAFGAVAGFTTWKADPPAPCRSLQDDDVLPEGRCRMTTGSLCSHQDDSGALAA